MKEFIGTCVDNPFLEASVLSEVISNATEITRRAFLKNCFIDKGLMADMRRFPNDYFFAKSSDIYFYEWSAIEHFYQEL